MNINKEAIKNISRMDGETFLHLLNAVHNLSCQLQDNDSNGFYDEIIKEVIEFDITILQAIEELEKSCKNLYEETDDDYFLELLEDFHDEINLII